MSLNTRFHRGPCRSNRQPVSPPQRCFHCDLRNWLSLPCSRSTCLRPQIPAVQGTWNVITQVVSVDVYRLVRPFTDKADLPPSANVLGSSASDLGMPSRALIAPDTCGAKNSVELLDRELAYWVVLVDHDGERVVPARHIVAAGHHGNFDRIMIEDALELLQLIKGNVTAGRQVGSAGQQACEATVLFVLDVHVGMEFPEASQPPVVKVAIGEIIRSHEADCPRNLLLRFVFGQVAQVPELCIKDFLAA